ncbi:hypothetical protein NDK43_04010 [Neobacillus pocheonensis]|uniref:Lycopene cyclase domain-containing protein n=1 Tax=Neobacillus pocheonensis TaxID=363869 RepID=A0ABT0W5V7_9BACI|nr:hypothetical protein [Neobacillus pocheonensis]
MIGLIMAIILVNFIAFKTNKRLTKNQIVHIWLFTIAFQMNFDFYIDMEYHGYWYFTQNADLKELPTNIALVPPANMIFLNFYPFEKSKIKQGIFFILFLIGILTYEAISLLPEPWGYFHFGWWNLGYSAILDPILLLILLGYYKWICTIESQ